ncbi:MAG TPA: serine/threonine-protein kinase [Ktedonobacterales bacterium]
MTAQEGSLVGQTLGVYRLRSLLGVGGMAEVYLAEDPSLRRDIAVKVLPRSLAADPGYVERFRNEAQRVASLSHPNITPVYTFGEERGLLYLVMPRLKESLRERMDQEGQLPMQEAARITNQIAAALYIAHQHGIVHRDVKPENILLDESGKAMLTDFGIARELASLREAGVARTLAATGLPVGTPEYMAPEQLRGMAATEQVDLYALGVVLYEMLTGHVPHDATTPYEVATAVLRDEARPPSYYNHTLSGAVENVIMTAMAKDPVQRYPDMKAFALALRNATSGNAQAVGSGALRWTHYAPVNAANSGSLGNGPVLGKSLASASSGLIKQPQIALGDTTKRPTVGQQVGGATDYAGTASAPLRRSISRRSALLLGAVALVALVAMIAVGMSVSSAMGLFTNSVGSPTLTHKPKATATATPAPTATTAPTATPAPTNTPIYIYVQVTPTPPRTQKLSVSPTTVSFSYNNGYCTADSTIAITNTNSSAVTWKWTSIGSLSQKNFYWSLNGSNWKPGLPTDSAGIPAGNGSDSLDLATSSCSAIRNASPVTVTMKDSLGNTYTLTLTAH